MGTRKLPQETLVFFVKFRPSSLEGAMEGEQDWTKIIFPALFLFTADHRVKNNICQFLSCEPHFLFHSCLLTGINEEEILK